MGVTSGRRLRARGFLALLVLFGSLTACGEDPAPEAGGPARITLTVDVFGDRGFGYDKLYEQYMKDNPHIVIEQRGVGIGLGDYNNRLTQWMESAEGAGDIVALEEGTIVQYKAQADKFVNLLDHGAAELEGTFLPWKWEQALTADDQLLGLGTDVGSMAMCYRKDLFAAAGLPTERDEVGALWPTWEEYIDVGKQYAAKTSDSRFVDAATNIFNTMLAQYAGAGTGYTFFDREDKLVLAKSPAVQEAWATTVEMIEEGLSAGLASNSSQWTTGFVKAQFATLGCPAWMTGVIQGNAGAKGAGQWDIAKAPGDGGNWGGSFLAVPKQSKHPAEAVKLAMFLTSPDAQIEAFNAVGNLPSSTKALDDPGVLSKKNEYFSNAPTGEIFAAGAKDLKPVYFGAKNQPVRNAVENALRSIERGHRTAEQAWQDALRDGAAAAK
jgi:cellobiose transport system substrate-binding protein